MFITSSHHSHNNDSQLKIFLTCVNIILSLMSFRNLSTSKICVISKVDSFIVLCFCLINASVHKIYDHSKQFLLHHIFYVSQTLNLITQVNIIGRINYISPSVLESLISIDLASVPKIIAIPCHTRCFRDQLMHWCIEILQCTIHN